MLLLLAAVFWLTIVGANVPSQMLANALFWIGDAGRGAVHRTGHALVDHRLYLGRGVSWPGLGDQR